MYKLAKSDSIPLNEEQSQFLYQAVMMEKIMEEKEFDLQNIFNFLEVDSVDKFPPSLGILYKRLTVMNLPIKFTDSAFLQFLNFCDRPGHVVTMLIDLLENYENSLVRLQDIIDTYPFGFYKEESFIKRAESFKLDHAFPIEERKIKYSFVY